MIMSTLAYNIVDVFTKTIYTGNPLAIVHVPPSVSLTQSQKLAITGEFNLSETVFLHHNPSPSTTEWTVDIFTPGSEIPWAGHPTIGTACHVLKHLALQASEVFFNVKAGRMSIRRLETADGYKAEASIPFNVHIHDSHLPRDAAWLSSSEIGLAEYEHKGTFVSIVKGVTFLLVNLPTLELLGRAKRTQPRLEAALLLDEGWNEGFLGKYYYVLGTQADGSEEETMQCRLFETDIPGEDPATGAAACALSCFLALKGEEKEGRRKFAITQGVEMGRESKIGVEVVLKKREIETVFLSGDAVEVMEGTLNI